MGSKKISFNALYQKKSLISFFSALLLLIPLSLSVTGSFAAQGSSVQFSDPSGNGTTLYINNFSNESSSSVDYPLNGTDFSYHYDLIFNSYEFISNASQYLNGYYNIHFNLPLTFSDPAATVSGIQLEWESKSPDFNLVVASQTYNSSSKTLSFTAYLIFTNFYHDIRRADLFDMTMHLSVLSATDSLTVSCMPAVSSWTESIDIDSAPDPDTGFADIIAIAIDNCSRSAQIVQLLTAISNNSVYAQYLDPILTKVTNVDQVLSAVLLQVQGILNYLKSDIDPDLDTLHSDLSAINGLLVTNNSLETSILDMFTNQLSANHLYNVRQYTYQTVDRLNKLLYTLTGQSSTHTDSSTLISAFQSNLSAIIVDALNSIQADTSTSDNLASSADTQINSNHAIEDAMFQANDQAIASLDLNPVGTFQGRIVDVVDAAVYLGTKIEYIHLLSGPQFQFFVASTLTVGLFILVLGVINHGLKH